MKKHPDRKPVIEERLRDHEKLVAEWQEYLTGKTLRYVALDHARPEATGLVFFPTESKWKGAWKPQEHLVIRLPIANLVLEFPFTLPPLESCRRFANVLSELEIGIGGVVAHPPLPHHRTCGSAYGGSAD